MGGAIDQFALPPLNAYLFLAPLFLQSILLHPSIPATPSRVLRFVLMLPALYGAFVAPFRYRIEPAHLSVGANFRWGVFGPVFVMKALEWGLARDRSAYVWIGFDDVDAEAEKERRQLRAEARKELKAEAALASGVSLKLKNGTHVRRHFVSPDSSAIATPTLSSPPSMSSSLGEGTPNIVEADIATAGPPAVVKSAHVNEAAKKATPFTILMHSIHLCMAMRGIGYAFGPPPRSLGTIPPREPGLFLRYALSNLLRAHIISTISLIVILNQHSGVPTFLHDLFFPYLPSSFIQPLANVLAYLFVGISLHSQLEIGHEGLSILFLSGTIALRAILPESIAPAEFDSREWPCLFNRPWAPRSVTFFWSSQWHALFRKQFTAVGYDAVNSAVGRVLGRQAGKMLGAVAVFTLSSWMHDQALWSARFGLSSPSPSSLPFSVRWGAWIFFLSQAVAVFLEAIITKTTGRKFQGGVYATIWSYFWIVGVGLLAGRCWIALGLVKDLPLPEQWTWERWVVPSASLAPPPLFMK